MARRSIEALLQPRDLRRDQLGLRARERPLPCQLEHLRTAAVGLGDERSATWRSCAAPATGRASRWRAASPRSSGSTRRPARRRSGRTPAGGPSTGSASAGGDVAHRSGGDVDGDDDRGHADDLGVAGVAELVDLPAPPTSG